MVLLKWYEELTNLSAGDAGTNLQVCHSLANDPIDAGTPQASHRVFGCRLQPEIDSSPIDGSVQSDPPNRTVNGG